MAGGCYFLGGFGRLFSDKIDIAANGYDSVVPTMLSGLPDLLIAIVVILVLSASMSTLSSLVLTSSSTLTLDLLKGNVIKDMDEKRQVRIMRWLIVVFVAISVVIALIQYRSNVTFIAQLMGVSWGALAGASFPGTVPLWPLLEGNFQDRRLGQHPVLHDRYAGEHVGKALLPGTPSVPDQLRRFLHDRRTGTGPRDLPDHAQA